MSSSHYIGQKISKTFPVVSADDKGDSDIPILQEQKGLYSKSVFNAQKSKWPFAADLFTHQEQKININPKNLEFKIKKMQHSQTSAYLMIKKILEQNGKIKCPAGSFKAP